MSAAARARVHAPPRSRSVAPRGPRRVSGPVTNRHRAAGPQPVARPRLLAGLRDGRALDRLLRGRAWIWVIGCALMGIVAMQVSLLKLNTGISRAVQTTTTLERANANLEKQIAKAASSERISRIALERGMVAPSAGSVVYVRARPGDDALRAARRMGPPSIEARALAAAPPPVATETTPPAATDTAAPAPTATPTGVAAAPTPGQG